MSRFPNISVADFAENLLEGTMSDIATGNAPIPDINNSSPSPQHMAPDVSKLEVPASMIESITGRPVAKAEVPINSDLVSDQRDDIKDLLVEAKTVVSKLKSLLGEDTSPGATQAGHLGTGPLAKARAAIHAKRYPDDRTYDDIMRGRGYSTDILPAETPGTETPKVTIPYKTKGKTLENRLETAIKRFLSERTKSSSVMRMAGLMRDEPKHYPEGAGGDPDPDPDPDSGEDKPARKARRPKRK